MANDIRINIITDSQGADAIGKAADALNDLGKAGQQSGDGLDKTTGSLGGLVKGAADAYGAFNILTGALKQGGGLIQGFYDAGVASERFTAGLNALSGGKADQYLTAMSTATHGLIDNTTLARDAALALSTGIAKSSDEASKLAGMGATLGLVFQNDAAGGVDAFFRAFEHPGQTRPLAALGYDIAAVKDEMAQLKKEGMDLSDAWSKTLFDQSPAKGLGDALDGAGTAVDRLNTKLDNLKTWAGTRIAIGIDATLNLIDALGNKIVTDLALGSKGHIVTPAEQPAFDDQNAALIRQTNKQAAEDQMLRMLQKAAAEDQAQAMLIEASQGSASAARAREATLDSSSNTSTSFTSSEASARGNARGGYNVASPYEPQSDKLALSADAAQRLQAATDQAANSTRKGADAAGDFDMYLTNMEQKANKVANNLSLAQAFGTTSGGIGGEIGGGLSADVSAERGALVKKGASKAELAQFDDQAKSALDNYKIATGQATPESIKFGDALSSVDKAARAGKISTAEAANEYLTLANAAKNGATSVGDLERLMGTMAGTGGSTSVTQPGGAVSKNENFEGAHHGGGMKTAMLPFDDVKKGADDTLTKVTALTTATTAYGPAANDAASVAVAANGRISQSLIIVTGLALAAAAAQRLVHQ